MRKSILGIAIGSMLYREEAKESGDAGGAATGVNTTNANETEVSSDAKAEVRAKIQANFDNTVDVKDFKFHFKKVKETDDNGKPTGVETKRPTVEVALPTPSVEGIIKILETGGKGLELLLDAVTEVIAGQAREIVNSNEQISQDNFPMDQISWEFISNLPKSERRGGGIAKETWEEFVLDYTTVMPSVTGKTAEQVGNAAKILMNKFSTVKTNKPVLKLLKEQIALYTNSSPNAEQFAECVSFLVEKADNLLKMDDAALLANL